jgi:5'-deoxynucleotidase YfbR-like HD superfamily hydrolase
VQDIFEELYFGRVKPFDRKPKTDQRYIKATDEIKTMYDCLKDKLSPEYHKALESFDVKYNEIAEMEALEAFKVGFSLAMRFIVSSFQQSKNVEDEERLERHGGDF